MPSKLIRKLLIFSVFIPLHAVSADSNLPSILVFGDSLSAAYGIEEEEGWVNLLEERVKGEDLSFRIINGSVSGETSTGGVERLPGMLSAYSPKVVIIELGGNDGLRGLPLNLLNDNLNKMVDMVHESGSLALLAGIQIPPNYGPRYTVPFTELYYEIAETKQIAFIPFLIEGIPQQPELMQDDGIHPKAEAQSLILENVWPYLLPLIEK